MEKLPSPEDEMGYIILPAGLIPGVIISPETIRKTAEAEQRHQEKKNKKNKPPKPPRRPNARIDGLAIGERF